MSLFPPVCWFTYGVGATMSLWEARLSTEHVGRYMDCGVGSSDLEYMKCSETGLWGQRALYNKYTRWRTGAYLSIVFM